MASNPSINMMASAFSFASANASCTNLALSALAEDQQASRTLILSALHTLVSKEFYLKCDKKVIQSNLKL
jgi:hypothetical protein